ncbi:MAG: YkvA family protein [Pseudomonadota bacterium]
MELEGLRSESTAALRVSYAPADEKRFWAKLRRVVARIPFAEDLVAAYYCAMDRDTPGYVRAVLFGALAYFVLPTDLVPDMLAGLGFTDDASVIAAAIAAVGRHLEPKHREAARRRLDRLAD